LTGIATAATPRTTIHEQGVVTMNEANTPGPEFDEEEEGKVLDDLDPDDAEAAGITGGGNYDYGDGPVTRK
jgi:hypothetical protein